MNNLTLQPIVGVSTSFTGKYQASKCLIRFLELLDVKIVKSSRTKPSMIEAAGTIASSDYCLPLRVYVGHIYHLINDNPEMNYILAPIIKGEYQASSTCAKYRDLDGVLIRSLGNMTGYHLRNTKSKDFKTLSQLLGIEEVERLMQRVENLPRIIAPEIESVEKDHLRQVCKSVYADIFNWSKPKKLRFLTLTDIKDGSNTEYLKIEKAFEQAYNETIAKEINRYQRLVSDQNKIRLALVGRDYLVEDPALSADIKTFFTKKGVSVITARDLPFEQLKDNYEKSTGFYDTHKLGQAFIDTVIKDVDGFIVIGSFGCHPDAFQVEYFANYIADQGKACWTFKFDEQTGGVGFHTRYETILAFLQQKRDERVQNEVATQSQPTQLQSTQPNNPVSHNDLYKVKSTNSAKPLFIWPYMGSGIDLMIKEVWNQLGLANYLYPPKPVDEAAIDKGNVHYTETCSPYALSMGSVRDSLDRLLADLKEEAVREGKEVEPRRIIILMARGKGPCTFGWYSIAVEPALIKEYSTSLQEYGHTLEMISIDNQGRNLISFLEELMSVADNNRLEQLIDGLEQLKDGKMSKVAHAKTEIQLIKLLKKIVWSSWKKLLAFEELQNKALIVRAHEKIRGNTTRVLKKWVKELESVHTLEEIIQVKQQAIKEFEAIPQDHEAKPKVVIVGEIYVALTSFANRGAVDNLLGLSGIEAIEGMRLSHFIRGAFKGLKYHYLNNQPLLKPLLKFLEEKAIYNPNQWVREPLAKPFLQHEIGGDGQPTVAHAREHLEHDGVDGILHIYPFKCMPEGMAKDALREMCEIYGVKSLHLSFDKETEIERLRTEIGTFATLLHQEMEKKKELNNWHENEIVRRQNIGKTIDKIYRQSVK